MRSIARTFFLLTVLVATPASAQDHATTGEPALGEPALGEPALGEPALGETVPGETDPSYTHTDVLTLTMLGLHTLHTVDHVLRMNHSGWPFRERFTPFLPSILGVYALYGLGYLFEAGPNFWIAADSVALLLATFLHWPFALAEPPSHQYDPYADGSNLFGVESPALGVFAVIVSFGLQLTAVGHLISSIVDGIEHGFTWDRQKSSPPEPAVTARVSSVPGGASVDLMGRW